MYQFEHCRGIYSGGLDVAVGSIGFDIKSGPSVMNKSMVDAFLAKQYLIQEKQLVPEINTYKIALGYGKKDNLNSFMAQIESDILDGRQAWTQITGIEHSPELVFAIASLIPRIFGVDSIVSSILGKSQKYQDNNEDNTAFMELLVNNFSPIILTPEVEKEIQEINSLLTD